jgi:hypothetical protein
MYVLSTIRQDNTQPTLRGAALAVLTLPIAAKAEKRISLLLKPLLKAAFTAFNA